uniref:Uncharacterized protein n=1 Tax=Anguilla anguilla TaxID=7936 RepID=A0A0E9X3U5_ANGAN
MYTQGRSKSQSWKNVSTSLKVKLKNVEHTSLSLQRHCDDKETMKVIQEEKSRLLLN